jgi:hypothetical protein
MDALEKMKLDAELCNQALWRHGEINYPQKLNKLCWCKWHGRWDKCKWLFAAHKLSSKHIENSKAEITSKTPGPKSGFGWRNSPLTKKEIDDICFFIDKGWDRQSISQFVGVSVSTVDKYKYARA